jgi:hypothetical protein
MSTPSSQGATLSFNGSRLGSITRFRASPASAVYFEKTHVSSEVVGFGAEARVLKSYDCTAIDPGTVEVTLWGCPPYNNEMVGLKGTVSLLFAGGSLSLPAFLDSFEVTGQVGQFLVGSAVFRLTGERS